jgi:DNA-binding Lrp family transcriptional regulator
VQNLMSYTYLLPSMTEYAKKFGRLDSLDFRIIKAMLKHGVTNVQRLTREVEAPQQTISYRIRRLDNEDLVRFRALIDETKLGLKSYSVLASISIGKEDPSGIALTSFPLWRYLAVVDGWRLGNYIRYAIPQDKERDLTAFLDELRKRELISNYEICETNGPRYPLLDLDFYAKKQLAPTFSWENWADNLDSYVRARKQKEEESGRRAEFDLVDLIILRCLELNARTTQRRIVTEVAHALKEKDSRKFIPMVSRRIRKNITPQGLIKGCRVYLFPNQEYTVLLFMFYLEFSNITSLEKFASALSHLPYNTAYEKILGKDAMFVRLVIPSFQFAEMRKSLTSLAEKGYVKDAHMFLLDLAHGTWDNVEMHHMFKDGAWNFSYGAAVEMLEETLQQMDKKKSQYGKVIDVGA